MKKLISIILLAALNAGAQSYSYSTNLFFTNTVEASDSITYTGTNCLDVSRYKFMTIALTGSGTNTSTNTITATFLVSPDATNYTTLPYLTLSGTVYGTNPIALWTNIDCSGFGYVRPYQVVSSVTNTITNFWTLGILKMFPRN